jgi:hypothetical protein
MPISLRTPSLPCRACVPASLADSLSGSFLTCLANYDGCDDNLYAHSTCGDSDGAHSHVRASGQRDSEGERRSGWGAHTSMVEMELDVDAD